MTRPKECKTCGTTLPPDAPAGVCPNCLLRAGIDDLVEVTNEDATLITNREPNVGQSDEPATEPYARKSSPVSPVGTAIRYFGDYEIIEEIARGGMGVVYKARQVNLNRTVALKMILTGQLAGKDDVQRFYTEAEAAAQLDHPGIVPIFEIGEHEGQHYFSMAYIEGDSLAQKVANGPLPPHEAAEIVQKVCQAIAYAHGRGVVHRDLKPANVLMDPSSQPKVTDFGLAKRDESESNLTGTGQILGTPSYMPPEQASGRLDEVGPGSDVYSVGGILYCLLTGCPPFQSSSAMDTLLQVLEKEPVAPRALDPKLPVDLNTICLKCLEKNPKQRYASAAELSDDLQRYLAGEPITARPPKLTRLVRHWIGQNIGAIGWAVVVGALFGLFASLHTLQTEIAVTLSSTGDGLDRLGIPRDLHPMFSHLPKTPDWLHAVEQFVLVVLLVMAGLIVVILVRPRNRPADFIAGTLSGLSAAAIWFLLCLSWGGVYGKMQNTTQDLIEIKQAEANESLPSRVLARYPELQNVEPDKQIPTAWVLARHRQVTDAAFGMIQATITSLLVFVPALLCETMLAGWLTRKRESVRGAILPYLEIGIPFGVILANFMMHQLLIWLGLARTTVPMWMSTLLYVPLIAAVIAAIKQSHWPWRVVLHVLWFGAIVAIVAWSIQVTNEAQRVKPILGVGTVENADECVIDRIMPGSPADRAGFQAGDVIEDVDGQTVSDFSDLIQIVQSKRVGEIVTVTYRREGKQMVREVELSTLEK